MKHKFIPLYREKEFYTLFYDKNRHRLYKFQHRNKSFMLFFMFVLLSIYGSELLDTIYQPYKTPIINLMLYVVAIALTYYIAGVFYRNYYIAESKREIILDDFQMERCSVKGAKQFRIEFFGAIAMLPVGVIFSVIFFITSQFRPLIVSCVSIGAVFNETFRSK